MRTLVRMKVSVKLRRLVSFALVQVDTKEHTVMLVAIAIQILVTMMVDASKETKNSFANAILDMQANYVKFKTFVILALAITMVNVSKRLELTRVPAHLVSLVIIVKRVFASPPLARMEVLVFHQTQSMVTLVNASFHIMDMIVKNGIRAYQALARTEAAAKAI